MHRYLICRSTGNVTPVGKTLTNERWVMAESTDKIPIHSHSPRLYEAQFFHFAMGALQSVNYVSQFVKKFVGKQWQCYKSSIILYLNLLFCSHSNCLKLYVP